VIRAATLADFDAVKDLVLEHTGAYERLKPDHTKMNYIFNMLVSSKAHFAEVVEDDQGVIQGALLALGSENLWATKRNCAVLFWASKIAGTGVQLLRRFKIWWQGRPVYRVAGFSPDLELDPRTWNIVERLGFVRYGGSYLLYRG